MSGIAYILDRELAKNSSHADGRKLRYNKRTGVKAKKFEAMLKESKAIYTHQVRQLADLPDIEGAYYMENLWAAWKGIGPEELVHKFEWVDL